MDFDPISGLLFAVLNDAVGGGGLPKFLATIDTNTGTVTIIHSTVESFDAIACAFPSTVAIPTLPQWGMILLVLSLLATRYGYVAPGWPTRSVWSRHGRHDDRAAPTALAELSAVGASGSHTRLSPVWAASWAVGAARWDRRIARWVIGRRDD
jgi:hypothetical protein